MVLSKVTERAQRSPVAAALADLLEESLADPWGAVSVGYYDTAQLVRGWARAPDRLPRGLAQGGLSFLLRAQNPDGSWGSPFVPPPYRLVPSLAAVAGLLALPAEAVYGFDRAAEAVQQGLMFLIDDPDRFSPSALPDTVAIEFIVPALLEEIDQALRSASDEPSSTATSRRHLALPLARFRTGIGQLLARHEPLRTQLRRLRAAARSGEPIPEQISFSLEVLDAPLTRRPVPFLDGHVGCSPSATAIALTWASSPRQDAINYLTCAAERRGGGALPHYLPMATFERSWIVANMARLGVRPPAGLTQQLASYFASVLTPSGVPMGPGLPADADITSTMLFALHRVGMAVDPGCLMAFEVADAFANYPGERTKSTTTNAHILEALGSWSELTPADSARYLTGCAKASAFLLGAQQLDGSWVDKWHASPYYATACAALALDHYGNDSAQPAVDRAIRWVLDSQRADGSWGRWHPTLDETAHSLHLLLSTNRTDLSKSVEQAVRRGAVFLAEARDASPHDAARMPLWHSKEIYEPERVLRGLVLTVLQRYQRSPYARHS